MIYMGGKIRYAKELLPILLKDKADDQWYIEPFCGGCNIIDKVPGKRIANDKNKYLIALLTAVTYDNFSMEYINKELYQDIRDNKDKYLLEEVGWAGFIASYSSKFFGGFAGHRIKDGKPYNDQQTASNNLLKQSKKLHGIEFTNYDYSWLDFPKNSIVYCDPPYQNTTKYKDGINYEVFWNWVRVISKDKKVFVSEYSAPEDFICIWEKVSKNTLDKRATKVNTEKLFILK